MRDLCNSATKCVGNLKSAWFHFKILIFDLLFAKQYFVFRSSCSLTTASNCANIVIWHKVFILKMSDPKVCLNHCANYSRVVQQAARRQTVKRSKNNNNISPVVSVNLFHTDNCYMERKSKANINCSMSPLLCVILYGYVEITVVNGSWYTVPFGLDLLYPTPNSCVFCGGISYGMDK